MKTIQKKEMKKITHYKKYDRISSEVEEKETNWVFVVILGAILIIMGWISNTFHKE